jgi:hypothetical protein
MKQNKSTQINLRHKRRQLHAVPHKNRSFTFCNPKVTEWNTIRGRFEVVVMVTMKITIFWNDTSCNLVPKFRSKVLPLSSGSKRRTVTRHYIPEYCIPSVTQFSAMSYWFDHHNVVLLRVQLTKFMVVHFSPYACYFLSLRFRYSLQYVLDLEFSRRWLKKSTDFSEVRTASVIRAKQ